ncbi:MarR family winged helix-turn-helix transcriptional regulator [Amycolatopsis nigrescens]|uniref:MarR family winged helix-turn-helix transcriptional regulator n=1 Tax=Amycolatopsis nigrescens TaxID=381445 RepID=UPI0003707689|nr:MarR family transcriptional regulator [Amycolatopsis nigrescens]
MSDKPPEAAHNTAALLFQAHLRLAEVINSATRELDPRTRPAHATVLVNMEREGIRLTRLAEKAVMTPQAMGELVDDLERLGYLRRVPDPSDRRAKLIVFTERGHSALEAASDAIAEIERRLVRLLGRGGYDELHATLNRITTGYSRS